VRFSVQRDTVALPESSKDIGLDSFVALSNGREIDNPRHLKRGLAHLRRAQRRLSRRKAAVLVAKAHRKIRNQRAAFHHHLSRGLVEHYGLIAVEDLNIQGLSRGKLAGPVYDAGWHSFFAKLSYWPASAGREMVKWDQPSVRMRSGRAQAAGGANVRYAGCRRLETWSPRKSYSNAPGSGVRGRVEDVVSCVPREAVAFKATE
jgi:putative transposase